MSHNIKKAVVWGDSVARGVIYDDIRERYSISKCSAASIVTEKTGIEVLNRSKMGMTLNDGIKLIERDLDKGVEADMAIIGFGGNDCDFNWKNVSEAPDGTHEPKTPSVEFETKLRYIIEKVRRAGLEPVLCTLPPINAENYFNFVSKNGLSRENILHWLGDINHIYRFHENYSLIISRIATECKCKLIDIRSAFLNVWNSNNLLCKDGIHPSDDGQKLIGKAVLESINKF